jgi:hypothetical protein
MAFLARRRPLGLIVAGLARRPSAGNIQDGVGGSIIAANATGAIDADMAPLKSPLNILASLGLALGGLFGLVGTMTAQSNLQALAWSIDSCALVMACTLLALKFHKMGSDIVASGFLVFSIGEGVLLSGTAAGPNGSIPSFAAGIALWTTALLLISIPKQFPIWVRGVGIVAAVLFLITAARIFAGEPVLPTASPLPFFAYPFLVITFAGWIWTLLREPST